MFLTAKEQIHLFKGWLITDVLDFSTNDRIPRWRFHLQYSSYNDGGYDCLSMAGVQTVVRNFGESLVIETGR